MCLGLHVCQTLLISGKITKQADHREIHQQTMSVWGNRFQINHTSNGVKMVWEYKDFFGWKRWYKWEVRGKRQKERQSTNRRDLRSQGTSIERCGRYRWGRKRKREWGKRNKEASSVSARRLNADFKAGPRSTPIVNFPPCLLELPLTRRWTDK